MANIYVRSTDGSDADNGTTWALAKATISGAAAIDAAGDTIYLSQVHSESTATALTIALAGTLANFVKYICVNDGAEPPTSVSTGAIVQTTGASGITISGSGYLYGVDFRAGSSTNFANLVLNNTNAHTEIFESCCFRLTNSSSTSLIYLNGVNLGGCNAIKLINCLFEFGRVNSQTIQCLGSSIEILGGSVANTGGTFTGTPFNPFAGTGEGGNTVIRGLDLSGLGSSINICTAPTSSTGAGEFKIFNSKLPASWSGGLTTGTWGTNGCRVSMYNCDSGNTNYRLWIETYSGTIRESTAIYKSGGSTDGTTASSLKMTTNANASEFMPLVSDYIYEWKDTTGTATTVTIDIIHDSTTALTDAEIWVEVEGLANASYPLSTISVDKRATILTTAADQTTSTATWTTTGLTNPNKQKLEVTFTPQQKGNITVRVFLAKASYTVYIDDTMVLS